MLDIIAVDQRLDDSIGIIAVVKRPPDREASASQREECAGISMDENQFVIDLGGEIFVRSFSNGCAALEPRNSKRCSRNLKR